MIRSHRSRARRCAGGENAEAIPLFLRRGFGIWIASAILGCSSSNSSSTSSVGGSNSGVGGQASSGGTLASGGTLSGGAGSSGGTAGSAALACINSQTFSCPALDSSKVLSSLQPSEAAAFCDCEAAYAGGYGSQVTCSCPDGSPGGFTAPASQAACLSNAIPAGCPVTLAQYTACTNLLWSRPCDDTAIAAAVADPSCVAMLTRPCPWGS